MYRVVVRFKDLQDNNYIYNVGDSFPHAGYNASAERIAELASDKNRRGQALIEYVEDATESGESDEKAIIDEFIVKEQNRLRDEIKG